MKYGLPYKGSKNKLAERIVSLLPKRTHLIDLFCGGCAVSHAALLRNKYEHIHINDINWMCPTLFIDALNGKYQNETRWISREDFFRLKDTDPYVAVVWSFGNNMRNYLYSKEIEPLKKAIHYAIFFRDYSLGKDLGYDLSFIEPISDIQCRYAAVKRYFSQFGHFQQQSFERGGREQPQNCKLDTSRGGRIIEIAEHRGLRTTQHQPSVLWGQIASVRLETIERLTNIRQNFNIKNAAAESAGFKKKKSTGRTPQRRTSQLHCTDCNTESDSYPCREIRGGNSHPSHQVCLIISKLRYKMTA
nr:MAG TPA: D12 class N6 adenine-specific DNA methyltransferase [Caudoviricetes sp.]